MCNCRGQACGCSSTTSGCQSQSCSCSCHKSQSSCQQSSGCGCGSQSKCGCKSCKSGGYAAKFLELANQAWMEVLKEKIKEHIQSQAKGRMDELAGLIAEANHERWQKKMEAGQCCGSFEERLNGFFGQSCEAHNNKNTSSQDQHQQGSSSNKNK